MLWTCLISCTCLCNSEHSSFVWANSHSFSTASSFSFSHKASFRCDSAYHIRYWCSAFKTCNGKICIYIYIYIHTHTHIYSNQYKNNDSIHWQILQKCTPSHQKHYFQIIMAFYHMIYSDTVNSSTLCLVDLLQVSEKKPYTFFHITESQSCGHKHFSTAEFASVRFHMHIYFEYLLRQCKQTVPTVNSFQMDLRHYQYVSYSPYHYMLTNNQERNLLPRCIYPSTEHSEIMACKFTAYNIN